MKLKDFASELTEDKEEKVIESTKPTANELMPKLNEYKIRLEEMSDDHVIKQVKMILGSDGDAYVKDGKYYMTYKGKTAMYRDAEYLLKDAVHIQTSRDYK